MPHIAIRINCDGDKCGECRFRHYDFHSDTYECIIFHEEVVDNRLPECLAGELVECCDTCEHEYLEVWKHPCSKCNCETNEHWQPATKGE